MENGEGDTGTGAEAMAAVAFSRTDRSPLYISTLNRRILAALFDRKWLIDNETTWEKILKKEDIPSSLFVISGSGFSPRTSEVMEMIYDKLEMDKREFQVIAISMCTTDVPEHSYVPTMLHKYGQDYQDYHVSLHYRPNDNTLHHCDCNRSVLKDSAFSAILNMLSDNCEGFEFIQMTDVEGPGDSKIGGDQCTTDGDTGIQSRESQDINRLKKEIEGSLEQLKCSTSQTEINLLLVNNCKEMSSDEFCTMVWQYFGNATEDLTEMDQGLKIFSSGMRLKIKSLDASATDISKDERLLTYSTTGSGPAQKTLQIALFLLGASTLKPMDEMIKNYESKLRTEDPKVATAVLVLCCDQSDIIRVFRSEAVRDSGRTAEECTSVLPNRFPLVRYAQEADWKFMALFLASMKHVFNDLRSKHMKIK